MPGSTPRTPVVVAVDAGTTGVRSVVVDHQGAVVDLAYRELTQHFPRPGWVEHDAAEIWDSVAATLADVAGRLADADRVPVAIGITNQRESVVAWDRQTGRPLHRAIVWQDSRTAADCDALVEAGHLPTVRARTGLVLDPYFSATKMRWMLRDGGVEHSAPLALGTVDAWVLWNLTGGATGGLFATDATNASRTLLYDIVDRRWSDELCDLFDLPMANLPEVRPSSGRLATVAADGLGRQSPLAGVPISGVAGDQHAALFGQVCFEPGMAKATYGTGSFVLMNVGADCPAPVDGLLTTLAWDLGQQAKTGAPVAYALEGSVFVSGAAVQWLRDGLGIIDGAAALEPLAASIDDTEGVYVVPAFTGLGSPHWDPYARGTITGLSRGTGRAHLARAVVEAMGFQVRDVLDAMAAGVGRPVTEVRVDGGASVMDVLLQLQADQTDVPVARPTVTETTALGAATLAGLAEGVWSSQAELAGLWDLDASFVSGVSREEADRQHGGWRRAVDRSRGWALP
ncbi:MAG TPA: glycerol kinase GlpK [Acidimicrobiales bacterium]|nr:glycerol kinase GlpK [Acidimicrobiales bacterium]